MSLADPGESGGSDWMRYCSSCGMSLEFVYDLHTCDKCGLNFCSSCNGLKLKLAYMNGRPDDECRACQILQKTNTRGRLKPVISPSSKEPEARIVLQESLGSEVDATKDKWSTQITSNNDATYRNTNIITNSGASVDMPSEAFVSDESFSKKIFFRKSKNSLKHENDDDNAECTSDGKASQQLSVVGDNNAKDTSNYEITPQCDNSRSDVENRISSKIRCRDTPKSDPIETEIMEDVKHTDGKNESEIFVNDFQDQHSGMADGSDDKLKTKNNSMGKPNNLEESDANLDAVDNGKKKNPSRQAHYICTSTSTIPSKGGQAALAVQSSTELHSSDAHASRALSLNGDIPNAVLPSSSSKTANQNENDHNKENDDYLLNPYKAVGDITESNSANAWSNILEHVDSTLDVENELGSSRSVPSGSSYAFALMTSRGPLAVLVYGDKGIDNRKQTSGSTVAELENPAVESDMKDGVATDKKMVKSNVKQKQIREVCPGCGRPECTGNKYMILLRQLIKVAQHSGLEVRDVVSDGNCMFTAVIDQLSFHGDKGYNLQSLRKAAINYLRDHPHSEDGTHYSEFLSSETWEEYLNRMERDGVWGDHMTLRAIAEMTSRTIQVISAEEGRDWTVIEPKSAGEEKLPAIYLGHVGEFHYVSLRPSVHWKSLESHFSVEDQGEISGTQAEETGLKEEFHESEKADMFKEDHIDAWTELPMAHFSFALKRIFPHKFMQSAETWSVRCMQYAYQVDFGQGFDKEVMGSVAEGFYVPLFEKQTSSMPENTSEFISLTILGVKNDVTVYSEGHKLFRVSDLFYETDLVHPGYLHVVSNVGQWGSATSFVPSSTFRLPALSKYQAEKFTNESYRIGFNRKFPIALFCAVWPAVAEEWQHRQRSFDWPKGDIIQRIVSEGCHVSPKAHKSSINPNIEWQFLFCKAEKTLALEALSKHQKYCYILFKAMYSHFLKQFNMISSGHLKSIFFYACEFVPESMWSGNPGACVLYLIDQLKNQIDDRNIPNYFIPGNNMIDHFTKEMFEEIQPTLMSFRTQLLSAIQQMAFNNHITCAQSVIEKILDDIPVFLEHLSVRESFLTIFLPETIKLIQDLVCSWKFRDALELASEAYEERLAVSTCSDSVPFQIFLSQVLMNMTIQGQWWFCFHADKHFGLSMVEELSTSIPTVKFGELVGKDVAGVDINLLVPVAITTNIISFCYSFINHLSHDAKYSESLPYIHFCIKKFKEIEPENDIAIEGYESEYELTKRKMLEVYWLAYCSYKALDQMIFFQDLMPEIQELCVDINTEQSSRYLSSFLDGIEDFQYSQSYYEGRTKTTSI